MPAKTTAKPRRKGVPRKAKPGSSGLEPIDCKLDTSDGSIREVVTRVEKEGGSVAGSWRDPLGGKPLVIAILPIDRIEPTPFQRDLSEAHHKKLAGGIQKTGTFLDPVITVPAPDSGFWTPNGRHRLEAMRRVGAKAITTLIAPDPPLAWQILALHTEKAHNLKERSLEVARIYRGLIDDDDSKKESDFAFYLEEAALVTLGFCYEKKPVFAGGAYHPILRRLEQFSDESLKRTVPDNEKNAKMFFPPKNQVLNAVKGLKEPALTS